MTRLYEELLCGGEIMEIPALEPLIEGVLDKDSTALLYGGSGYGKSVVALDWSLCVATGRDWNGHHVEAGKVLYVVGEGLSGTQDRYAAWCLHNDTDLDSPRSMFFAPRAVNILTMEGKRELREAVSKIEPVLTILDTVARHIPGGDENTFETMSQVVEMQDQIRLQTGGCALAIHHPGKDASAGARGHSSLKGALDTEILCSPGPMLTVTKQKNHPDGHILGSFELVKVGRSVVAQSKLRRSTPNDEKAILALRGFSGPASYSEWKAAAVARGLPAGSFDRARDRLLEAMVVTDGTDGDGYEIASP